MAECRSQAGRQSRKGGAGGPHQKANSRTTQARTGAGRCVFKAERQQAGARQIDRCNGSASILSILPSVLSINAHPGGWVKERVSKLYQPAQFSSIGVNPEFGLTISGV